MIFFIQNKIEDFNNCAKNLEILLIKFCENYGFKFEEDYEDEYDCYIKNYKSIAFNNLKFRLRIREYSDYNKIPYKLEYRRYDINYYGVINIYNEITKWILNKFIFYEINYIEKELKKIEKSIEEYNLEISKIILFYSESFKYSLPIDIILKLI